MPIDLSNPSLVRPGAYSEALDQELERQAQRRREKMAIAEIPPDAPIRDVMVVLLGSALLQQQIANLTVGQTVDHLLRSMEREGFKIERK